MAKVVKQTEQKKPLFDPTKNYTWKPEDEFVIDGKTLQQVYNTLLAKTQDKEWIQVVNEFESFKALQEVFVRGVEQGVIVEAPTQNENKAEEASVEVIE